VLAAASFDYELIRHGAIAHVPLTDDAYQQAYESLHEYLAAVVGAAPVDVIALEWFPGSVSSDAVDKFPDVVSQLQKDLPGKIVVVESGYSTASGGEDDQSRFYTQTFNNLTDMRTNQGVESSFAGIVWRTAMDRPGNDPAPPSAKTPKDLANWNWADRAAEVTRMWTEPGSDSKEMSWWLGHVESHFGLLSPAKSDSKSLKEKASYQLLAQLKSSLAVAADATGASDIAKELTAGAAEGGKGVGGALKDRLQSALFGMLDAWVAKTAENLVSGGGSDQGGGGPPPPPPPAKTADLQIVGLGEVTGTITEHQAVPLAVTLYNAGTVPATNVVLYLREGASNDLANSTPSTLSPGGSTTVNLPWTPAHPGNFHDVTLDAYCDNEGDPSTNVASLGDIAVAAAPSGGGGGGGGAGGGRGLGGLVLSPSALGGVKGTLSTKTDPGFVQIQSIRSMSPVPMSMPMSAGGSGGGIGGGSTPMSAHGTGAGVGGGMTPMMARSAPGTGGGSTTPMMAPGSSGGTGGTGGVTPLALRNTSGPIAPVSLAFTVSNPFGYNFLGVKATLRVNGGFIATKDLGVLSPSQRRTVTFGDWTPPRAGTYAIEIVLVGMGAGGHMLTSKATDQLVIDASGTPSAPPSAPATRSLVGTPAPPPPPPPRPGAAPGGAGAMPLRLTTRALTPMMRGIGTGAPIAIAPRSIFASTVAASGAPDLLGLTANAILVQPLPVALGKPAEVSVRLFNSERAAAAGVKVEAYVDQEKLGETKVDVPVARAVLAHGWKPWSPKPGRHSVRIVVTAGARTASAVKPVDVTPPHGIGMGGVAALTGRGIGAFGTLSLEPADIQLTPALPTAGASVVLSVRVRNTGASDASAVRVEVYADGIRLGEATGDIAAGKDHVFPLPRWTAAAGAHKILCRAILGAARAEATRDVSVGATAAIGTISARTLTATPGMATLLVARPDLQILPTDIHFSPLTPKAGDALTISMTVRNGGSGAANGGSVLGILQVDGAEVTRRQFPVSIPAGGSTTLTWSVTTPSGKQLAVTAHATMSGDSNSGNDEARATTSVGVVLLLSPKLVMPTK
ncbi:MAG TPA: CARDB domain-containing protein, partial [Candidatus Eisenbacteria bacterium]